MDAGGRPLTQAWPYEDETERMAEEHRPPPGAIILRAGTREQLMELYGLQAEDFAD
jgi:hypothetical protein